MNRLTIALTVLIGTIILSRFIAEAGLKKLSAEQKGLLVEVMAPFRKYGLVIWLLFALFAFKQPLFLVIGVLIYLAILQIFTQKQIKSLSLPSLYARYCLGSSATIMLGISTCAVIMPPHL